MILFLTNECYFSKIIITERRLVLLEGRAHAKGVFVLLRKVPDTTSNIISFKQLRSITGTQPCGASVLRSGCELKPECSLFCARSELLSLFQVPFAEASGNRNWKLENRKEKLETAEPVRPRVNAGHGEGGLENETGISFVFCSITLAVMVLIPFPGNGGNSKTQNRNWKGEHRKWRPHDWAIHRRRSFGKDQPAEALPLRDVLECSRIIGGSNRRERA